VALLSTFNRSASVTAVLLALGLCATAHAGELYRYKDPFGVWRQMTVANGMARRYKHAQVRASNNYRPELTCGAWCTLSVDGGNTLGQPAFITARVQALRGHAGKAEWDTIITTAAKDSGVDRALLSAVIAVESGFRKDARSPKGALGLMQLMPGTAATLITVTNMQTALVDPATNVSTGSRHLRRLIDQYPGRLDLALAAYNAGEGAVNKYDGVPPYAETQAYVRQVMALYASYHADAAPPAAEKLRSARLD
jgi:soluble lytic murein transglycosylase-like protein